jgi:mRNA-degrading endonuclease RelE of RelBE toxin-antitoxin system
VAYAVVFTREANKALADLDTYRVLNSIEDDQLAVLVLTIGHRREVYR